MLEVIVAAEVVILSVLTKDLAALTCNADASEMEYTQHDIAEGLTAKIEDVAVLRERVGVRVHAAKACG
jgi:hypothetical protein